MVLKKAFLLQVVCPFFLFFLLSCKKNHEQPKVEFVKVQVTNVGAFEPGQSIEVNARCPQQYFMVIQTNPADALIQYRIDSTKGYQVYNMPVLLNSSIKKLKVVAEKDGYQLNTTEFSINYQDAFSFVVFPNPANDQVTFEMENTERGTVKVSLSNAVREEKMTTYVEKDRDNLRQTLDISSLSNGVYYLILQMNTCEAVRKIVD